MAVLESLEVRWFLSDKHPALADAKKWFGTTRAEGQRVDYYLLTGRDDLGFKVRAVENVPTKFEAKQGTSADGRAAQPQRALDPAREHEVQRAAVRGGRVGCMDQRAAIRPWSADGR